MPPSSMTGSHEIARRVRRHLTAATLAGGTTWSPDDLQELLREAGPCKVPELLA